MVFPDNRITADDLFPAPRTFEINLTFCFTKTWVACSIVRSKFSLSGRISTNSIVSCWAFPLYHIMKGSRTSEMLIDCWGAEKTAAMLIALSL